MYKSKSHNKPLQTKKINMMDYSSFSAATRLSLAQKDEELKVLQVRMAKIINDMNSDNTYAKK